MESNVDAAASQEDAVKEEPTADAEAPKEKELAETTDAAPAIENNTMNADPKGKAEAPKQ